MEFSVNNPIGKLCLQGMGLEEKGMAEEASKLFLQAWDESTNDLEKFISAYFVARHQKIAIDKLKWLEKALQLALKINDEAVQSAFYILYSSIAKCYADFNDLDQEKKNEALAASLKDAPSDGGLHSPGPFWGAQTDPNPTDKAKAGSKRSILTDANGTPLWWILTGANRHDSQMALALMDKVVPVAGRRARPRQRPDKLYADGAYDAAWICQGIKERRVKPLIAKQYAKHGNGLGKHRWVVERTFAWLNQFRRLRVRFEKRADIISPSST